MCAEILALSVALNVLLTTKNIKKLSCTHQHEQKHIIMTLYSVSWMPWVLKNGIQNCSTWLCVTREKQTEKCVKAPA